MATVFLHDFLTIINKYYYDNSMANFYWVGMPDLK